MIYIYMTDMTPNSIWWISRAIPVELHENLLLLYSIGFIFCEVSVCSRSSHSRLMFLYCHPD